MRRVIPSIAGIDTSSIILLLALQMMNTGAVAMIVGASPNAPALLTIAAAELLSKVVWTYIGAIIIQIVMSWVGQGVYNPIISLIHALTEPLLRPARRAIPSLGGLDLSPMLVIVGLQLSLMLVVQPLRDLGLSFL